MTKELREIQLRLNVLGSKLLAGHHQRAGGPWRGADVIIAVTQPPTHADNFYPLPRVVTTPFALELSWLFDRLNEIFSGVLDGTTKVEFFGRLANAANRYLKRIPVPEQSPLDLLLAVTHEAHAIREEMEDGQFEVLLLAPGNVIWDDQVERGEASGYLGPEATRAFFDAMEKKHSGA